MEGNTAVNPKAKRGSFKKKRSDCPSLSPLMRVDLSGIQKCLKATSAKATPSRKCSTASKPPAGAFVIMDAGIASEENLQWLTANKYDYLVVSRERKRDIAMEQTSVIKSAGGHQIHLRRQAGEHAEEIKLTCWSEQRAMNDPSINESWASLRERLGQQYRGTATFKQRNGKTLHIRQATHAEEELGHIYTKLGISPAPGGLQRISI